MKLANLYEQAKQEGRQEGIRATIENLLRCRFGCVDEDLTAIIGQLVVLSPQEFTPLLLQLSREELLARFSE